MHGETKRELINRILGLMNTPATLPEELGLALKVTALTPRVWCWPWSAHPALTLERGGQVAVRDLARGHRRTTRTLTARFGGGALPRCRLHWVAWTEQFVTAHTQRRPILLVTVEHPLLRNLGVLAGHSWHGFSIGAVYNRQREIHDRVGGQRQRGISTSRESSYILLFTNRRGLKHGYHDFFDDDGIFHYYGEGRIGNMLMEGRNAAIRDHNRDGRHLLVFLGLGEGLYRYMGEFDYDGHYIDPHASDTTGEPRNAIVFRLKPRDEEPSQEERAPLPPLDSPVGTTQRKRILEARTKQALFRRRVSTVEKECRLTGVMDLRFLRASHIKPWSVSSDPERIDENNGLLLTPSADLLFDHGWVSFRDDGRLIVSEGLPEVVKDRLGLDLQPGRRCGVFSAEQSAYLAHHRDCVLGHKDLQNQPTAILLD